jgi:SAM-dependent methyltransferase
MTESGYTPQRFGERTRAAIAARGAQAVAGDLARWGVAGVLGAPWTLRGEHGSFELRGERHPYLFHRYKLSWLTERAVEVPVVQAIVDRHAGRRILEVGHVLGHFRAGSHTVVDKYEQAPGVLNLDVLELGELGPFDLIIAISTLEHVGLDEAERDPSKAPRAVEALRQRLTPGGQLVLTIPAGYNRAFDAAIRDGAIATDSLVALRRVPGRSGWREVDAAEAFTAPYDFLLYRARAVVFAFISRESE